MGKVFWTDVGQEVSLGSGCNQKGTIMHEIMHAIGFWHEQSRPDRNQYVEVLWENILPGNVILVIAFLSENPLKVSCSLMKQKLSPISLFQVRHTILTSTTEAKSTHSRFHTIMIASCIMERMASPRTENPP